MHQTVLARQEFDESAELFDRDDLATVDLIDFGLGGHAGNGVARNLHPVLGDRVDIDRAVVFDVDFATGFLDELLDVLAARTDEQPDLLGIDLDGLDARRVFAQFLARGGQDLGHLGQHMQAADARLFHGLGHHGQRDPLQLEVELKTRDALFRAGDLAIHVAEGVLPADDIRQQLIAGNLILGVMLGAQPDADAAYGPDHRHARVHQRQATAAHRRHRRGAVRFGNLAGDADRVGISISRHHRFERTLRQCAVADLPPARTADASGFANRVVREVVVQDEFLLAGAAGIGIEFLGVFTGAKRAERHRLGFAALKQRGAVRARQYSHFAIDRANRLEIAAIQTLALFHD